MTPIKQITIGGFRGILNPLILQFVKGSQPRSMVIYGRNGTGKSSITDAWEWFHAGKIKHLAREGAEESSYPNRHARAGETFVDIQFADDSLGSIRVDFDQSRITMPVVTGNMAEFQALVVHPCHIRFEDLTRFVYLKKSQRYDELAELMGFGSQVEFNKALRRVERRLTEEVSKCRDRKDQLETDIAQTLQSARADLGSLLATINQVLGRYCLGPVTSVVEANETLKALTLMVETDVSARELANLEAIKRHVQRSVLPSGLEALLSSYLELAESFKQQERTTVDLLLIGLYEQGETVLRQYKEHGEETEHCPLCGRLFEGDLLQHISSELSQLKETKKARDELEEKRKQTLRALGQFNLSRDLQSAFEGIQLTQPIDRKPLMEQALKIEKDISICQDALRIRPDQLSTETLKSMHSTFGLVAQGAEQLQSIRDGLIRQLNTRIQSLEQDTHRRQLVSDHGHLHHLLDLWKNAADSREKLHRLEQVLEKFKSIVDDFVQTSTSNVQQRFAAISADVQTYFGILEEHTEGLDQPTLKLLTDQDRAVVLEVGFYGEPIYPAYRYLSESQLNSFGLAVFLASAKYINRDFRFLLLDDIINSFDGYKRPQVLKLLKQEFSDYQILLLTHDSVWCDRLSRECPSWVRYRFPKFERGIGPICTEALTPLEEIDRFILADQPRQAGQSLGTLLECQLQELCESFEADVKYNQRNEYTLDTLLDRFRIRVKNKLNQEHELHRALEALQNESGFRNICAHWKNPEIDITSQEIGLVVERWKAVEALTRCPDENCFGFLRYNDENRAKPFVCSCGKTCLEKFQ